MGAVGGRPGAHRHHRLRPGRARRRRVRAGARPSAARSRRATASARSSRRSPSRDIYAPVSRHRSWRSTPTSPTTPQRINEDPYGDGWLCVIRPDRRTPSSTACSTPPPTRPSSTGEGPGVAFLFCNNCGHRNPAEFELLLVLRRAARRRAGRVRRSRSIRSIRCRTRRARRRRRRQPGRPPVRGWGARRAGRAAGRPEGAPRRRR